MRKWLPATLIGAAVFAVAVPAANAATMPNTTEASKRSDVLAASAAADAAIPHKVFGDETPTETSKPEVRPASFSAPAASTTKKDQDVATPDFTLWPINCDISADPPFKSGSYIYGRSHVYCEEATDITAKTWLQYSNDGGRTWVTYGVPQVRTTPGEQFIVQKQLACASAAPYRAWRVHGEINYNYFLSMNKFEYDDGSPAVLKC